MADFKGLTDPKLVSLINSGGIGIIPTDTVYGLVTSAKNQDSVNKIHKLKERNKKKGVIIAASIEELESLGLKHRYLKAVEEYWPGPVSIEIPTSSIINNLDMGTHTVVVRIPNNEKLLEMLGKTGPLLTSSANKAGMPPFTNINDAKLIFKNSLDFYVDGGDYSNRQPSAIIRIIDDAVEVTRPGYGFSAKK